MNMKIGTVGLVTVIVALAAAPAIKSCAPQPGDKIPPPLAKTLDSLDATRPADAQHRDSVIRIVVRDTARAGAANARADAAIAAAAVSQRTADSIAAIARQSADSARLWHEAFDAQRRTSDSLRVAVASKDSAYRSERDARARLLVVVHSDTVRMNAIDEANQKLRKRIGDLDQPCRIVGPIPCPSRTATMLVTTAVIVTVDAAVHR